MHDESAAFRFKLAGELSRHTARDLEQARQTAASIIGRRSLIVDLSGLTSLDATGGNLLEEWHALGAQLTVVSAEAQARIRLMAGVPVTLLGTGRGASQWLPRRMAALCLAALLVLLLASAVAAASRQSGVGMSTIATTWGPRRGRLSSAVRML
jgi:ABC-type transporter Mla MlaB component